MTPEQRASCKIVAFATVYGSEGGSVARELNLASMNEGKQMVDKFMEKVPAIRALRDSVHRTAMRTRQATTPLGRCRFLELVGVDDAKACRQAFNTYAQSGAADFQKKALNRLQETLPSDCHLVFTVFDSILIEFPPHVTQEMLDALVTEALKFQVNGSDWNFKFSSGVGATWKEAKENS